MKKIAVQRPVTGLSHLALAFLLALLVGCGDTSDEDPGGTPAGGAVTSANAPAVASETWTVTSVPIDVLAVYASPGLPLFSGLPFSATAPPLTPPTGTLACGPDPDAGSLSYVVVGTSIVVDFNDCVVAGMTLNGGVTISDIVGDPSACPGTASFGVAYDGFTVSDATRTIVVNGGYAHTLSVSDNDGDSVCETQHHTLAGTSLNVTVDNESFVLSGFSIEKTIDTDTGEYSVEFAGTLSSNAAGGTVSVKTTAPISGNLADTYPSSGVIEITDGTAVATMTINSSVPDDPDAVTVAYDADGDGTPEITQNYSWDDLKAM